MSLKVSYKGTDIVNTEADGVKTLKTAGKYCEGDITITYSGGGGGGAKQRVYSGVNFIDYDGTVVETWEESTVASQTALPANPSHAGLTAQGWNWTLADIKTAMAANPGYAIWVGQSYITDDGATRIYIELDDAALTPVFGMGVSGRAAIDWGDGSSVIYATGQGSDIKQWEHTYSAGGKYVITVEPDSDSDKIYFGGTSSIGSKVLYLGSSVTTTSNSEHRRYQSCIKKVELGSCVNLSDYAFTYCTNLAAITLPDYYMGVMRYTFQNCYGLSALVIPSSGYVGYYMCDYASALCIVSVPSTLTTVETYAFEGCSSLQEISLPTTLRTISTHAFDRCTALSRITMHTAVTTISLSSFASCNSLKSLVVGSSVTALNNNAFQFLYSLASLKFEASTPPYASNSGVFGSLPKSCKIYVPTGSLSAYQAATNYPSSEQYTYIEY